MSWFWNQYLPKGADVLDPQGYALLARDLSGLAPATMFTPEFDVLRDEGEDHARSLKRAGVPAKRRPRQIHDFTLLQVGLDDPDVAPHEAMAALKMAMRRTLRKGQVLLRMFRAAVRGGYLLLP